MQDFAASDLQRKIHGFETNPTAIPAFRPGASITPSAMTVILILSPHMKP
jgi:hypothetical protein